MDRSTSPLSPHEMSASPDTDAELARLRASIEEAVATLESETAEDTGAALKKIAKVTQLLTDVLGDRDHSQTPIPGILGS